MESCETRSFACGRPVWLVLAVLSCGWALDGGAMAAEKASNPNPADGEYIETTSKLLMWTAGTYAAQHRIYLGTHQADVADGTGGTDKGFRPSPAGRWAHVALVLNSVAGQSRLYINGQLDATGSDAGSPMPYVGPMTVGACGGTSHFFAGAIDEVIVDDDPWSAEGIALLVQRGAMEAWGPVPHDGDDVGAGPVALEWMAGDSAVAHDVYVGRTLEAVRDANTATLVIYRGRQPQTAYPPSGELNVQAGRTYYWRIDEVADSQTVTKGPVWRFNVVSTRAWEPDPLDGGSVLATTKLLTWKSGIYAATHNVYFGTNRADVEAGTGGTYQAAEALSQYRVVGLTPGQTYYWRVDEVNEAHPHSPWTGAVWSFHVAQTKASNPDPPDGAINVRENSPVGWTPGLGGIACYVYMGTSPGALQQKTLTQKTTYTPTGQYSGSTYYWRVDSIDNTMNITVGDVWRYTTMPVIGTPWYLWWRCNEGSGTVLRDDSYNGNTGTLVGGVSWVSGRQGSGLGFDGQTGYVMPGSHRIARGTCTVWMYVRYDRLDGDAALMCNDAWDAGALRMYLGATGRVRAEVCGGGSVDGQIPLRAGQWEHVALVLDHEGGRMLLYINGILDAVAGDDGSVEPYIGPMTVGACGGTSHFYAGALDEIRVDRWAWTQQEVWLFVGGSTDAAYAPYPRDGAVVEEGVVEHLTWLPGDSAVAHDVYLGVSRPLVQQATVSNGRGVYMGRQTDLAFPEDAALSLGSGAYYWRVDEVDAAGGITQGPVWSFSIGSLKARDPSPADGAINVLDGTTLTWNAGAGMVYQEVFFETTYQHALWANEPVLVSDGTSYTPSKLVHDWQGYYWRVDTIDGDLQRHKGDVWSFTTTGSPTLKDPNLMVWWRFDEGQGDSVHDGSGHGRLGRIVGDAVWVAEGIDTASLELDGDDYVEALSYAGIGAAHERMCIAWIKSDWPTHRQEIISWGGDGAGRAWVVEMVDGRLGVDVGGGWARGRRRIDDGRWHHVAAVLDDGGADVSGVRLFVDGVEEPVEVAAQLIDTGQDRPLCVGGDSEGLKGTVDYVMVYDISAPCRPVHGPCRGATPQPALSSVVAPGQVERLRWSASYSDEMAWPPTECVGYTPAPCEAGYDVYFGTDREAVGMAVPGRPQGVYMGRQDANEWPVDGGLTLSPGGQYFWRIDTIDNNGVLRVGRVWWFSAGDFLVVDDFESYGDTAAPGGPVECVWKDGAGYEEPLPGYPGNGSGSAVGIGRQGVHGGGQMLVVDYDNAAGPYCSFVEARTAALAVGPDWSREQVRAMSVWFKGEPDNSAEWMYVELVDGAGRLRRVFYPDVFATRYEAWTQWHIALGAFQGVDLADVESVSLGIGTPGGGNPAGAGRMCFDDIRLYRRRCVPEFAPGDATGDCRVNWADVAAVAGQWLAEGLGVAADMDGDGVVDFRDMAAMLENWLIGEVLWP